MINIEQKNNGVLIESPDDLIVALIFKRHFEAENYIATIYTKRKFFNPRRNWDLKDVLPMCVPQEYRYSILKSVQRGYVKGQEVWLLGIIPDQGVW